MLACENVTVVDACGTAVPDKAGWCLPEKDTVVDACLEKVVVVDAYGT